MTTDKTRGGEEEEEEEKLSRLILHEKDQWLAPSLKFTLGPSCDAEGKTRQEKYFDKTLNRPIEFLPFTVCVLFFLIKC